MTQAQKLEQLLQKAVEQGYQNDYRWKIFNGRLVNEDDDYAHSYPLIFNHDFARALFGVTQNPPKSYEARCEECGTPEDGHRYHLQQAVISNDPIDYIYSVVFGEKEWVP